MPITTSCSCGRKLNLKDELAGKTVKCPQCGTALKVPDTKSTATAVATPPPSKSPADSKIMPKLPPAEKKAGPKVVMANFKSLDDFDEGGNLKKQKKKEYNEEEKTAHETGSTGGEMAKIAAEAMKAADERPKNRCPGCGRGVKADDVVCTKCGTNIKTGRRLGESKYSLTPKKILLLFGVLMICAAGAVFHAMRKPIKTPENGRGEEFATQLAEKNDTLAKLELLVNDADPDASRALPHITNVGVDALPMLSKVATSGAPSARRKAVKLIEILAFNKYRSEESVQALGTMAREQDTTLRDWAAEALFWSGCDVAANQAYWPASEEDPQKVVDPTKIYPLPYSDCREQLANLGVTVSIDPKIKRMGDHGRLLPKSSIVPLAGKFLEDFYGAEMLQQTKLTRLIQAVRAGRVHLLEKLISYLEPEPCKELGFTPSATDVGRAWRCLRDITGRASKRFDDWKSWWKAAGRAQYPRPPDPVPKAPEEPH